MCSPQIRQDLLQLVAKCFLKRRSQEILRLKYLKPDGQSRKTKQKLEESCSQVVFAILIPAKLTQIWRTSCLRIAWRILRMHDRKLNGCRQRLLFAHHLIPRKCSLCSQGSILFHWNYKFELIGASLQALAKSITFSSRCGMELEKSYSV